MLYHFTPVRMAVINKSTNSKGWWRCGEERTLVHCWWESRLVQPLWKTVWNFLKNLKMELPFDPALPLLEIYLKNPKTPIQKNLCIPIFLAALLTSIKCWKQTKCPSVGERIKKLWHIYTTEYYSTERKKECLPFATACLELETYYAKWNKPVGERQIPYDLLVTWI